jgi:hypothetical protein
MNMQLRETGPRPFGVVLKEQCANRGSSPLVAGTAISVKVGA